MCVAPKAESTGGGSLHGGASAGAAGLPGGAGASGELPVATEGCAGLGKSIVTVKPSFSMTAERGETDFKRQPDSSLPSSSRTGFCVD